VKVKTPKEDPRAKALRDREEQRADAAYSETTSQLLDDESRRRLRRLGSRTPGGVGMGGGMGGGSGGPGMGGGGSGGSGTGGGGMISRFYQMAAGGVNSL
jgi:hypothetical protein